VAVARKRNARLLRHGRRGHEADELEVGRARVHGFQGGEQMARRSAAGAEVDTAAGTDRRQRLFCTDELRAKIHRSMASPVCHSASRHLSPGRSTGLMATFSVARKMLHG
jgi:hypothetical protein